LATECFTNRLEIKPCMRPKIFSSRSGRTDRAKRSPCVLTESQIFSRPARTAFSHMTILFICFYFFGGTKTRAFASFLVGPYAFLVRSCAFFRPYHSTRTALIRDLFQGNSAWGRTDHMMKSHIKLFFFPVRLLTDAS